MKYRDELIYALEGAPSSRLKKAPPSALALQLLLLINLSVKNICMQARPVMRNIFVLQRQFFHPSPTDRKYAKIFKSCAFELLPEVQLCSPELHEGRYVLVTPKAFGLQILGLNFLGGYNYGA